MIIITSFTVIIWLMARRAYSIFPNVRGALITNFTDKILYLNCFETESALEKVGKRVFNKCQRHQNLVLHLSCHHHDQEAFPLVQYLPHHCL